MLGAMERVDSHDSMDVMVPPDMVTEAGSDYESESRKRGGGRKNKDREDNASEHGNDHAVESKEVQKRINQENRPKSGFRPIESSSKCPSATPPPPKPEKRGIVMQDGLEFDMDVPWQRSLLKELRNDEVKQTAYRNDVIMLGHTESRDFAVDIGVDDFTLTTDSSSTMCHGKPQAIHRPWIYPDDSLIMSDEISTGSSKAKRSVKTQEHKPVSPRTLREERDVECSMHIPTADNKSSHQQRYTQPQWLEMEVSEDLDDSTVTTAQVTASNPSEACYCMGYNVLEYLMVPPASRQLRGGSRRSLRLRQSRLGRVEEEDYPQVERKFSRDPDGAYHGQEHHYRQSLRR